MSQDARETESEKRIRNTLNKPCRVEVQGVSKVRSDCACSPKKDTPESFILLFFSPKKLVQLFLLKEVKPSPDSKIIKLLTCDKLFPPLGHSC